LVVEGIASGRHWQHVPRPANFDTTIRHRAKLTEDQVREIRHLLKAGHSQGGIAKRFDVVRTTIRDITTGRTWGWLAD
jgi:DNA invertase Pin-like site-specific DNA recombinase